MELFSLGGTRIKCSPMLFIVIPAAFVFHRESLLLAAFLSLTVHEAAHGMLASRLGYEVRSIEIQPFGFVAELNCDEAPPGDLAAIYAAGPVASLSLAAMNSLAEWLLPAYKNAGLGITSYNLLIMGVNLLPALPLDGGRLIYAAFSVRGRKAARRLLKLSGTVLGMSFIAVFCILLLQGFINPTFLVMGVFLVLAALKFNDKIRAPLSIKRRLSSDRILPVSIIAAHESMYISEAVRLLPQGKYALISVLDDEGRKLFELDEYGLSEALRCLGLYARLSDAVAMYSRC